MLGRDRNLTGSTGHTVGGFAEFFKKKIDDIRSSTASLTAPQVGSRVEQRRPWLHFDRLQKHRSGVL